MLRRGRIWLRQRLHEMRDPVKVLVPSFILALSIGAIWGDPLSRTVLGILGIPAAVYGYFRLFLTPLKDRRAQRGHWQKRNHTQDQQATVDVEAFLLYQSALAMTIKELDGAEAEDRTAEWFRGSIDRNLSNLVSGGAEAAAREMVRQLTTLSQ